MTPPLSRKRFAFLAADGVEEASLAGPWRVLDAGGGMPELVSSGPLAGGRIRTMQGLRFVGSRRADLALSDVADVEEYTGVVLPGGLVSADAMRLDPLAVAFLRAAVSAGKPLAVMGHSAWLLIEADLANGQLMTGAPSLRTDLLNAGARWSDDPVVVHRSLLTAQGAAHVAAFGAAVRQFLATGVSAQGTRRIDWQKEEMPS